MAEHQQLPFDAGDRAAVQEVIKTAKQKAAIQKETVRSFVLTEEGRRWFYNLLVKCHCYHNPFSSDPLRMAHNCGEMNIGQQVLVELENADPELYLLMLKENSNG